MNKGAKKIHMICNAHLDPVWLWQWEDGLTETMSTFRVACEFCERVPGFVFCHNEAVLYRWVEEHDPALFDRIKKHVAAGRWHVAGGSYLQPDINMPSGESHIRQFLKGKEYFRRTFGVEPTTAYNFDPFGQAEGYVQILSGCGFDSYIFMRPNYGFWPLPTGAFRWRDRSGLEILARRSDESYLTAHNAYSKLKSRLPHYADEAETLFLWGVGNHGGGPSREDLRQIEQFAKDHPEYELAHSTPEAFFASVKERRGELPVVSGEMQNCFPGCYTSMSRVKRAHRRCESLMAATERMAAMAWWLGRAPYPAKDLDVAWHDILFGEFHDILPGSSIQPVEKDTLAMFGHCSEILRRTRARVFLKLLEGERPCPEGDTPIFVWNPHSFPVALDFECEFNYGNIMARHREIEVTVRDGVNGRKLDFQREQSAFPGEMDWRVKIVVPLKLAPFQMRRIEVSWRKRARVRPWRMPRATAKHLTLKSKSLEMVVNARTGLVDFAAPAGSRQSFLKQGALRPTVWPDSDHAWNCGDPANRAFGEAHNISGPPWKRPRSVFRLATRRQAAAIISPPSHRIPGARKTGMDPVRVVEYGPVRTIIEAIFVMGASAVVRRYVLSKTQNWFEVRDRIFWNERDSMLKLAVPLAFRAANTVAETPYGAVMRPTGRLHVERVNQRWVAATGGEGRMKTGGKFVAVLNDCSHAHSIAGNTLYVSILRSPTYSAFYLKPEFDTNEFRHWPRQDQGEHEVRYRFLFGEGFQEAEVSRAGQAMNIAPPWLVQYPWKAGKAGRCVTSGEPFVSVSDNNVQVAAVKKAERGDGLVVRLWEQAGRKTPAALRVRGATGTVKTVVPAYGLNTLILKRKGRRLIARETNLIERAE